MIKKIRSFVPHWVINYGKHWPEAIQANLQYGFPSKRLRVIGVTGTDGKTTTVNMIFKMLQDAGLKTAMISTINAYIGGKVYDTGFHVTSPRSFDLQKYLKMAVLTGDEYLVLEVTSHALEQFRVWGIKFEIGVITNITHEHLDYHGSFTNYLKAKSKLIKNTKFAVLNFDDSNFSQLKENISGQLVSFGFNKKADLNPESFPLKPKIPGDFNILNALAAACVGQILGIDKKKIISSLESFSGLPGRMEFIPNKLHLQIVVDFAHTPKALEFVLRELRKKTKKRLMAVFGCASERDRQKRPLMGKIASQLADVIILTDEDPRFENREKIIEEIAQGMDQSKVLLGKNLFKEPDREKAIKLALSLAKKGDVVGIFGKGHEQSMGYLGKEIPWSDNQAVRQILGNGR